MYKKIILYVFIIGFAFLYVDFLNKKNQKLQTEVLTLKHELEIEKKTRALEQENAKLKQQLEEEKKKEALRKQKDRSEQQKKAEQKKSQTPVVDNSKIFVKGFRFEGEIKLFPVSYLHGQVSEYINRTVTFEELQSAKDKVGKFYKDKGYFLASTTIPKQEIIDGIVVINVNEGKLDSKQPFRVNGENLRLKDEKIIAYAKTALEKNLHQHSLERALLNINDNPQVDATASLEPGDDPGSTRIILDVSEGKLLKANLGADNYGNRYIGENRGTATVNINDATGHGDKFTVQVIKATGEEFTSGRIAYEVPIGSTGLRADVSYYKSDYGIGKELITTPKSIGKSDYLQANIKYPLFRTSEDAVFINAAYDRKNFYNEASGIETSNKIIDSLTSNVSYESTDNFLGAGYTQTRLGVVAGKLDLSKNASNLSSDQGTGGANTDGFYVKPNIQVTRIQKPTEKVTIQLDASAQTSNKNLDTSEKLSLGGISAVRAYPSGEGSGDQGYHLSLEGKYLLIPNTFIGNVGASIFYDYGSINQFKDPGSITMTTPNSYSLAGYGLGLNVLNQENYGIRFAWAKTIGSNAGSTNGKNADGLTDSSRFLLSVNYGY